MLIWLKGKKNFFVIICFFVAENQINQTRHQQLVVYGAVSTWSYGLFHNWLVKEDMLHTVGGAGKICI